jgi:hypothetical protein
MAQAVEVLPSKFQALSSNPVLPKTKNLQYLPLHSEVFLQPTILPLLHFIFSIALSTAIYIDLVIYLLLSLSLSAP